MFGPFIDYFLLKPLCHSRNRSLTKDDARAKNRSIDITNNELTDFLSCFQTKIDFTGKTVLDVGCGDGLLALQIAKAGAAKVIGVDMRSDQIDIAKDALEKYQALRLPLEFMVDDLMNRSSLGKFDVIVSLATFEHVSNMKSMIKMMSEMLAPNGIIASVWGPLYHSPYGDHFSGFFRVKIPFRGIIFNEKALVRLYREFYRAYDAAVSIKEVDGGMNMLKFDEFAEMFSESGLKIVELKPRVYNRDQATQGLRSKAAELLCNMPIIRNYVASSPVVVLKRYN